MLTDNLAHRALFTLPPIQPSAETAPAVQVLPEQKVIAGANPANVLALLAEIEALHDRAAYWRQRAKSAEGHLHASDFQAACDALHLDSNYADTPAEQLTEVQKARISSAVNTVLRAVNARRDLRRPADVTDQRDNQNLARQAGSKV